MNMYGTLAGKLNSTRSVIFSSLFSPEKLAEVIGIDFYRLELSINLPGVNGYAIKKFFENRLIPTGSITSIQIEARAR